MKLILDIEEKTLNNMQGYCEQNKDNINELVERLFNKHIQDPANVIDEIVQNDGMDKLSDFARLLTEYMSEATRDIEESAASSEAYNTDEAMSEVFKVLNRDHITKAILLTDLYKVYKRSI